jgi:hypothetical protein
VPTSLPCLEGHPQQFQLDGGNRFGPRLFLPMTVRDELFNVAPAPAAVGIEDSIRRVAHERPDSKPGFLSHEIQKLGETKQVTERLLNVVVVAVHNRQHYTVARLELETQVA